MVVFLDLDEDVHDPHADLPSPNYVDPKQQLLHSVAARTTLEPAQVDYDRPNPNVNSFSAALSCYPIVAQLASLLDLNSLHDLSLTCRQFRANLLQYRNQLVHHTLRCTNESIPPSTRLADRIRESHLTWKSRGIDNLHGSRLTSGKVGRCARDMVGECRRCGRVVCRNCTVKPPPANALGGRLRRLCRTCVKVPLRCHTAANAIDDDDEEAEEVVDGPLAAESFTASAFERGPCTCAAGVWICQPCGHALRTADTTYMRGWTWRTRYSTHLGGLGTGIGEGNEGVECGRNSACLAAKQIETEIDVSSDEFVPQQFELPGATVEPRERRWSGTSYLVQEIEGVGGVVKRKVRRRVWVGATVREGEAERVSGKYLERERAGVVRSWCAWCDRVVPGCKDEERGRRWSSGSESSSG